MSFLSEAKVIDRLNKFKADVKEFTAFNSTEKRSSVKILSDEGSEIEYIKGAPERIIEACKFYLDENGEIKSLTEHGYLMSYLLDFLI